MYRITQPIRDRVERAITLSGYRSCLPIGAFAIGMIVAGTAFAIDVNFCQEGDECVWGIVRNRALVVVEKTHIIQQEKHGCAKVEKVKEKNLTKGGAKLDLTLNANCRYTIKFSTTKGCTGDKQGQISRQDIKDRKTAALLEKACGSLQVKIRKYENFGSNKENLPNVAIDGFHYLR